VCLFTSFVYILRKAACAKSVPLLVQVRYSTRDWIFGSRKLERNLQEENLSKRVKHVRETGRSTLEREREREGECRVRPLKDTSLRNNEEDAERGTHMGMSSGTREFNDESHERWNVRDTCTSSARHFYMDESVRRKADASLREIANARLSLWRISARKTGSRVILLDR
jgi:hypothetical protein